MNYSGYSYVHTFSPHKKEILKEKSTENCFTCRQNVCMSSHETRQTRENVCIHTYIVAFHEKLLTLRCARMSENSLNMSVSGIWRITYVRVILLKLLVTTAEAKRSPFYALNVWK